MDITKEQIKEVLESPEKAVGLPDDKLDSVVHATICLYGVTGDSELVEKLLILYRHYVTRIHSAQRLQNYQAVVDRVITGENGVHALMPFLCCDPDQTVASTAALDYVVLAPAGNDEPTAGASELLDMYGRNTFENGLAVLGGMIMTGDRRILALLKSTCRVLPCKDVETLIKCRSSFLTAAVVEFYLEWLEVLDSRNNCDIYGAVAAGFANLAVGATDKTVYDIERIIPSTPDNAVRILNQWRLSEYAEMIALRIEDIAQREEGEPIMPVVMSVWGLS